MCFWRRPGLHLSSPEQKRPERTAWLSSSLGRYRGLQKSRQMISPWLWTALSYWREPWWLRLPLEYSKLLGQHSQRTKIIWILVPRRQSKRSQAEDRYTRFALRCWEQKRRCPRVWPWRCRRSNPRWYSHKCCRPFNWQHFNVYGLWYEDWY